MLYKDLVRGDLHKFCFVGKALDGLDVVKERKHTDLALQRWQLRINHRTVIALPIPIHRKCDASSRTPIRITTHSRGSEAIGLIVNGGGKGLREAMCASLASSKVEVDELVGER